MEEVAQTRSARAGVSYYRRKRKSKKVKVGLEVQVKVWGKVRAKPGSRKGR